LGSDTDIDGDFGSDDSDSDINPIAVERGSDVDETIDVDAEFMDGFDVLETENSAEVSTTSVS